MTKKPVWWIMKNTKLGLIILFICFLSVNTLQAEYDFPYRVLEGHQKGVRSVAFSPDGSLLASASDDKIVKIWRVSDGQEIHSIAGHKKGVKTIAFSPDGTMLASGSDDKLIKLWRTYDWAEIRTLEGRKKGINSISFSPDGEILVTGTDDNNIGWWRTTDGTVEQSIKGHSVYVEVVSVAYSPDGEFLAYSTKHCWNTPTEYSLVIKLIRNKDGKEVWKHIYKGSYETGPVVFSPDGSMLAGQTGKYELKMWRVRDGRELRKFKYESISQEIISLAYGGISQEIKSLAFSPDGKILASGHDDDKIRFWDVSDGKLLKILESDGNVYSIAFSPDGRYLASGESDKEVRIWDISSLAIIGSDIATAPPPMYPPVLSGKLAFSEPSGNSLLDAEETAEINLTLTNSGQGVAYGIAVNVNLEKIIKDLQFQRTYTIDRLNPTTKETITIPLTAGLEIPSDDVNVNITVLEKNGFGLPSPLPLRFSTQALIPPLLSLDYGIDDHGNNNSKIEPLEMVTLTASIQNIGQGKARDVEVDVDLGDHVYLGGGSKSNFSLGELQSGESKKFIFMIYTNNKATSVPIEITATETIGKYGCSETLDLPFNIVQKRSDEVIVAGTYHKGEEIVKAPDLTVDVDVNIPETGIKNMDAVAVVIGNKNYEFVDIRSAEYAHNDASIVREYLISQFGYSDGNIIYINDAKLSDFYSVFGSETKTRGELARYVKPGISDVFIYYSGHGAPDVETKKAYFIPVDCKAQSIDVNGYSLDTFYKNISLLDAKSISVVIEACFSGNSGGGSLLKINPVAIDVRQEALIKGTVITSSAGMEVSCWFPEKKHSLFTYLFLKGISGTADQDQDRNVTVGELKAYLTSRTDGVTYWAKRIGGYNQTPVILGNEEDIFATY
jgi:WD40 repeat protein